MTRPRFTAEEMRSIEIDVYVHLGNAMFGSRIKAMLQQAADTEEALEGFRTWLREREQRCIASTASDQATYRRHFGAIAVVYTEELAELSRRVPEKA